MEQAALDQDLALLGSEVVGDLELVAAVDLHGDLVGAPLELLADLRQRPGLPRLGAVVVRVVLEGQGEDALCDEVATMDAGERLGEDGLHPELQRRQRSVLARGALAVVLAADDEPLAPLLQALSELRVAVAES